MCSKHILQDQIAKVFYEMLKKMILMLLLHVMTTLTKLFCVLTDMGGSGELVEVARGSGLEGPGELVEVI